MRVPRPAVRSQGPAPNVSTAGAPRPWPWGGVPPCRPGVGACCAVCGASAASITKTPSAMHQDATHARVGLRRLRFIGPVPNEGRQYRPPPCSELVALKRGSGNNGAVLRFLLRRLVLTIPVLLGVATLVFSLIHLIPGDPAQAMLGEAAPPAEVEALRQRLGLDRPLLEQYGGFMAGLARGDLGT